MSEALLIYGATGYTGRLLVTRARELGLRPLLGGRNAEKLDALAARLGLESRAASLDDAARLTGALADVRVVLNAAGPFAATAPILARACVERGVHYLDMTGEVAVMQSLAELDRAARARGVMLMPGVGFDVVPSDALALHVTRRLPEARRLHIATSGLTALSRGSARTLVSTLTDPVWVRREGAIAHLPPASLSRRFDYGCGPRSSLAISGGDIVSAYFSTGVRDITTYFETNPGLLAHNLMLRTYGPLIARTPWQGFLHAATNLLPDGPSAKVRAARRATIVAEAEGPNDRVVRARLHTPEAYSLSALTGIALATRVLAGDLEPGFQTPARVFGADVVLGFPGVTREDFQ